MYALTSIDTYTQCHVYTHTHTCIHTYNTHTHTQGSYGRLGLNNSDNQPTLKNITDFPQGTKIRRMATSRGSDGHSIAVNPQGNCYSWGDGEGVHCTCTCACVQCVYTCTCTHIHTVYVYVHCRLGGWGYFPFYFHCLLAGVLCTCTFMYITCTFVQYSTVCALCSMRTVIYATFLLHIYMYSTMYMHVHVQCTVQCTCMYMYMYSIYV